MNSEMMTAPKPDIEAKCNACGQKYADAGDLGRGSLDAFADLSVDYDLFCTVCDSDDITLFDVP